MAVENRYPLNKPLITSLPYDSSVFYRPEKALRSKTRPNRKSLGLKHLIILFMAIIAFFVGIAELYYYAISCEQLRIKRVEVTSSDINLQHLVENFLGRKNLGNILICDLHYLRIALSHLPGVKDVRLEKVLPSTLKVEVYPRIPRAYVYRGIYYLVDEEGQVISSAENLPDNSTSSFPLLEDENGFKEAYQEKISTACQVLDSLQPEVRSLIKKITFRDDRALELELVDDPVKIIVDETDIADKLNYYLNNKNSWAELFGQLEYVDLRIEGRAYIKSALPAENQPSAGKKEVS